MKPRALARALAGVVLACSTSLTAHAGSDGGGTNLGVTRVVLTQADREQTLPIIHSGKRPALFQLWLDQGDRFADPAQLKIPFVVSKPFFRLEPNSQQAIRILTVDRAALATDREALFYINVLHVPERSNTVDAKLNLAVRSRIKLFYRPSGLPGSAAEAPAMLRWRWVGQGNDRKLHIENPTPWHVNLATVELGDAKTPLEPGDGVVPPLSSIELPVPGQAPQQGEGRLSFTWIDDSGSAQITDAQIAP